MRFTDRLKDKKFRALFIGGIILFIIIVNQGGKKTQTKEVCDRFNTGGYILTDASFRECEANSCRVQYNINPDSWVTTGLNFLQIWWNILHPLLSLNVDLATCVPAVEVGKYVRAKDSQDASNQCISEKASEDPIKKVFGEDFYLCVYSEPEERCTPKERSIAKILEGLWKDAPGSCKTHYYLTLGIGGMLLFMMLGMMM